MLGAILIILYTSPFVIVVLCAVAYGYYTLQKFYRHSSRDIRRLESTYASPVGTLLLDCLGNAPVIRAQHLQSVFDDEFSRTLDMVSEPRVLLESLFDITMTLFLGAKSVFVGINRLSVVKFTITVLGFGCHFVNRTSGRAKLCL